MWQHVACYMLHAGCSTLHFACNSLRFQTLLTSLNFRCLLALGRWKAVINHRTPNFGVLRLVAALVFRAAGSARGFEDAG